jgi:hypothetical protein
MRSRLIAVVLACVGLILLVALTGNADAVDPRNVQDNTAVPAGELVRSQTVGQTFVFHYAHLHAVEVRWIVSPDFEYASSSRVVLHLRRRAEDSIDLAAASIPLDEIRNNDFAKFSFAPIQDSQDQSFYFFLDASQAEITRGNLSVWASAQDDYQDGQMYVNGVVATGDLVFRAYYEPDLPQAVSAIQRALDHYLPASLLTVFLLVIPGSVLLFLFGNLAALHPIEIVALAVGFGLAALSFASILLLYFGAPVACLGFGAAAALFVLLGAGWRKLSQHGQAPDAHTNPLFNFVSWSLGALALLSVAVGFLQIRDTFVPLWKDSPVHAETIAGILSQGHLASNLFYHFGFQSIAALVVQLSGISIPTAMLFIGQLLITQIGLSVFLLGKRLTGSGIAGLVSAVCVWFLSPTPAYFTTWGRYPLLLGAALLPLALVSGIEFVEQPRFDARTFLLVVITFWGMAFAHVRLTVLYLVFAAVYLADRIWRIRAVRERVALGTRVAIALVAGAPIGVLWLASINANAPAGRMLLQNVADYSLDWQTAIDVSLTHHGPALLVISAIALVFASLRRSRTGLIVLAWFGLLAGISALPVVGEKYLPPAFVVLMGFVPVAVAIGDLANWLYTKTVANSKQMAVAWGATLLIVSALGARDMISLVNPATILFSNADENAMTWIEAHTPRDSKFLINSDVWFGSGLSPSDGGWWISILTGRSIDYVDSPTVTESADVETLTSWINSHKIDLVYLGRRNGVLQKSDFICQPERFLRVYDQDGIAIFQVQHSSTRLAPRAGCAGHLP